VDGEFFNPTRGAKERNEEKRAQAAADRIIKQHMEGFLVGQDQDITASAGERYAVVPELQTLDVSRVLTHPNLLDNDLTDSQCSETFLTKGQAKAARRAARAAQAALNRPGMLRAKLEAHIAELEAELGLFRVTSPVNGTTIGQPGLQNLPIVAQRHELDVEIIKKLLTEARDAAMQTSLRRSKRISTSGSSKLPVRVPRSANSGRSLRSTDLNLHDKMSPFVDLTLAKKLPNKVSNPPSRSCET
jgi:hypothetical protein